MNALEDHDIRLTYLEFCKHQLMHSDRRVARRAACIFWKYKKIQTLKVLQAANIRLRRSDTLPGMNAGNIRRPGGVDELIKRDAAYRCLDSLQTSPDYMEKCRNHAFAMLTPTWFWTLTSRGHRQLDLMRILSKTVDNKERTDDELKKMSFEEAHRLIRADPVTVCRHYNHKLDKFIRIMMRDCKEMMGGVDDYFVMEEYQGKGDEHSHGQAWVKGAPKVWHRPRRKGDCVHRQAHHLQLRPEHPLGPLERAGSQT